MGRCSPDQNQSSPLRGLPTNHQLFGSSEVLRSLPATMTTDVNHSHHSFFLNAPPLPSELTLHPATMPSPPAHTIFSVARTLHQSFCEQVSWCTTGRRACWRTCACGPSAADEDKLMRGLVPARPDASLCVKDDVCGCSLESRPHPVM